MNTPSGKERSSTAPAPVAPAADIAFRLLQFQQRMDAWDRLYNEEVVGLRQELSQMKADYVRQYQTQTAAAKPRRTRRSSRSPLVSERTEQPR